MKYTEPVHFIIINFSLFHFLEVSWRPGPLVDATDKLVQLSMGIHTLETEVFKLNF